MYCHDLDVMSWNPGRVELGVLGTSAPSRTLIRISKVGPVCLSPIIHEKGDKVWFGLICAV